MATGPSTSTPQEAPMIIHGEGIVTPPPGMTPQEMERLAREADEARKEN